MLRQTSQTTHYIKNINTMKGKENKRESKKAKSDGTKVKTQSDYQKDKTRKSTVDPIVIKPKK